MTANPLRPLIAAEVAATTAILKGAKGLGATVRFLSTELHEPDKRAVLDGRPVDREAFVVLRDRDPAQHDRGRRVAQPRDAAVLA